MPLVSYYTNCSLKTHCLGMTSQAFSKAKLVNVRLAGDHLYVKLLFTWLSLVMSLMMSYLCCPFSHEMSWVRSGAIEAVPEIFPTNARCFLTFIFLHLSVSALV